MTEIGKSNKSKKKESDNIIDENLSEDESISETDNDSQNTADISDIMSDNMSDDEEIDEDDEDDDENEASTYLKKSVDTISNAIGGVMGNTTGNVISDIIGDVTGDIISDVTGNTDDNAEDDTNDTLTEDDDDTYETDEESDLFKFDKEIRKEFIEEHHPESIIHNYEEINALSKIIRDKNGNISDDNHKTIPFITKYERARILGQRTKQLDDGATPLVSVPTNIIDSYQIALMELEKKAIPFIIRRPLPNKTSEYWKLEDLELL